LKVGILTYHRVANDGSILQAYCSQKILSSHFPEARVEIIDYSPARLWWTEHRKILSKRQPFIRPWVLTRMKSMRQFVRNYLVLSSHSCSTDNLQKAVAFVENQKYDIVFVGSDTVWEARYSKYVPPAPNIYYLPGLNRIKKVSYAASADPVRPEFISNEKLLKTIGAHIKAFDYITVRDQATFKYLLQLGLTPEDIHFMADPTLQCEFKELIQPPKINKKRPLAGVGLGGRGKNEIVFQLKQRGYDVVDLGDFTLNGKLIPGAVQSVHIRLGIFSVLDFLITDRFHGSIFAIKLAGAPVVFVESSEKWPEANSKGRDLFQKLSIESMVWRYDGKNVKSDLIDYYLSLWAGMEIELKTKLASLRDSHFHEKIEQMSFGNK